MNQKWAFRHQAMFPTQAVAKCLLLIIFCLFLPILSGICPDFAGSAVSSLSSFDDPLSIPLWKNLSRQTISEKDSPEEEGGLFKVTIPLRLTGKQNFQETYFRKTHCTVLFPAFSRRGFLRDFFRNRSNEQQFSFQTIQSTTLPARASPAV